MTICAGEVDVTVTLGPTGTPLVLTADCGQAAGITWNTLGLPEWALRSLYAPPSNYVPGDVLLATVRDSGAVVMTVSVQGSSLADMEAKKTQVENALAAWPGEFKAEATDANGTVTIAGPWDTFPTIPSWGDVLIPLINYYYIETTFSLPVNPPGAP